MGHVPVSRRGWNFGSKQIMNIPYMFPLRSASVNCKRISPGHVCLDSHARTRQAQHWHGVARLQRRGMRGADHKRVGLCKLRQQ